jgi:N-acyl-D-amino-acid deacylase
MLQTLFILLLPFTLHAQDFDLLVAGGRVVDGSGNAWYRADVGIRHGRIVEIGSLKNRKAARVIDARDQIVSPGFIDMMGNSSEPAFNDRTSAESKLRQGITTILAGEGSSTAPSPHWKTFGEYFRAVERKGIPINAVQNVGAAQVRRMVIGVEDRPPSPAEMQQMRALVDQAMRDGAVGFSTALIYPPGVYASTAELVQMAKVVSKYGGIYMTHMRNESNQVLDAIRESIRIGEEGGVPVHIFHLKAAGEENWPRMKEAIALIQSARDRGLDVTADIYPYIRNGLGLGSFIHPRHYSNGAAPFLGTLSDAKVRAAIRKEIEETSNWENWYRHVGKNWDNVLVAQAKDKHFEGKSIAEIARMRGTDAWTTFFDLIQNGDVEVNPKSMNEEQKHLALRTEWISICTDSPPLSTAVATNAHPRAFGSFPRILAKYVREEKIISLEDAVRKMTSLAANQLKIYDRGRITPGAAADILIFDPERIQDTATFAKPISFPIGLPYVIVNGRVAIDNGKFTAENAGMILRRK